MSNYDSDDSDDSDSEQGAFPRTKVDLKGCHIKNLRTGDVLYFNNCKFGSESESDNEELKTLEINLKAQLNNNFKLEKSYMRCVPETENAPEEMISIATQYSPLNVVEVERKMKTKSSRSIHLDEIVKWEEIVKERILIEGDVGYGKTTLALKLTFGWEEYLKHFSFVFHIALSSFEGDSIYDYLCKFIKDKNKRSGEVYIKKLLQDDKMLIILDDLNLMSDCEQKLRGFFDQLPKTTFVVLTQPIPWDEFSPKFPKLFTRNLTILGFTEEGIDDFIKKYDETNENGNKLENFRKLLNPKDKVEGKYEELLKCSPLFLHVMCYLIKNHGIHASENITESYSSVFETLGQMFNERQDTAQFQVEAEKQKLSLISFGKEVFQGLIDDRFYFKQDIIDKCVNPYLIKRLGFLKRNKFLFSDKKKVRFYQPLHQSLFIYLGALYLSSLNDNLEKFNEEFNKIPVSLMHSKSNSEFGCRLSLFVLFLSGLLGDKAHEIFLKNLDTVWSAYYTNFSDILCLLNHCGLHSENISCIAKSNRMSGQSSLEFLFQRKYKGEGEVWSEILSKLFEHPSCSLKNLFFKFSNVVNSNPQCRKSILQALSRNTSVEDVELEKSIDAGSNNIGLQTCEKGMRFFLNVLYEIRNLRFLTFNVDCFVNNLTAFEYIFSSLFQNLGKLVNLEKLIISCTPLDGICDSFLDWKLRKCNSAVPSKKRSKKKIPKFSEVLVDIFIESFKKEGKKIEEIELPRLKISSDKLKELSEAVYTRVRILKLPFMEINDKNLTPLIDLLKNESCRIENLDLNGYQLSLADVLCLADVLKCNKTLISLNLSRCLDSEEYLGILIENLHLNETLWRLSLSSDMTVNIDMLKKFINICCQCKIQELHLSGWTFNLQTEFGELDEILKNLKLTRLCLKDSIFKVKVKIEDDDKLIDTIGNCINSMNSLEVLDLRGLKINISPIQFSVDDSAYGSLSPASADVESPDFNGSQSFSFSSSSESCSLSSQSSSLSPQSPKDYEQICSTYKEVGGNFFKPKELKIDEFENRLKISKENFYLLNKQNYFEFKALNSVNKSYKKLSGLLNTMAFNFKTKSE